MLHVWMFLFLFCQSWATLREQFFSSSFCSMFQPNTVHALLAEPVSAWNEISFCGPSFFLVRNIAECFALQSSFGWCTTSDTTDRLQQWFLSTAGDARTRQLHIPKRFDSLDATLATFDKNLTPCFGSLTSAPTTQPSVQGVPKNKPNTKLSKTCVKWY